MRDLWFAMLGLGFGVAGADKLAGLRGYRRAFRNLGLGSRAMRGIGATELAGAAMLLDPRSRRLGGALLAGCSAGVFMAELRQGETRLAAPRGALMLAALTALG